MSIFSDLSKDLESVYKKASTKVFYVPSSVESKTGISVDGKNVLVPAYSASEGEEVTIKNYLGDKFKTKVIGFSKARGLAVLELEKEEKSSAFVLASENAEVGSLALSLAYASEQGVEASLAVVRFASNKPGEEYFQLDSIRHENFTGAAIVNSEAKLIGVLVSNRKGNSAWAVPASVIKSSIDDIVKEGFSGPSYFGVSTIPTILGQEKVEALLITSIDSDGPAEKAGLLVGDSIIKIGNNEIKNLEDFYKLIHRTAVGSELSIEVIRANEKKSFKLTTSKQKEHKHSDHGWHKHWHGKE